MVNIMVGTTIVNYHCFPIFWHNIMVIMFNDDNQRHNIIIMEKTYEYIIILYIYIYNNIYIIIYIYDNIYIIIYNIYI